MVVQKGIKRTTTRDGERRIRRSDGYKKKLATLKLRKKKAKKKGSLSPKRGKKTRKG